jgi:hypothetical protein
MCCDQPTNVVGDRAVLILCTKANLFADFEVGASIIDFIRVDGRKLVAVASIEHILQQGDMLTTTYVETLLAWLMVSHQSPSLTV